MTSAAGMVPASGPYGGLQVAFLLMAIMTLLLLLIAIFHLGRKSL